MHVKPEVDRLLGITDSKLPLIGGVLSGNLEMGGNNILSVGAINSTFGESINMLDDWLRINPNNAHPSGIYMGMSTLRTDGEIHVGGNGAMFKVSPIELTYMNKEVWHRGNFNPGTIRQLKLQQLSRTHHPINGEIHITINMPGYDSQKDVLMVFQDNLLLYEGVHYTNNGSTITLLTYTASVEETYHFLAIKLVEV